MTLKRTIKCRSDLSSVQGNTYSTRDCTEELSMSDMFEDYDDNLEPESDTEEQMDEPNHKKRDEKVVEYLPGSWGGRKLVVKIPVKGL